MEELRYREGDRGLPIPENERDLPAIRAEEAMEIPAHPDGLNIMEGLCLDRAGDLFICNTPQSRIYKLDMRSGELSVFVDLPDHMTPSAVKIHRDGRIFATVAGSDRGSLIAVMSPEGELMQEIPMESGRMIDDMVFDADGGFNCTDLDGTAASKTAGVLYVEPDLQTVHPVIADGMVATNGISLDPDGRHLWVTEYGAGALHRITLQNAYTIQPAESYVVYRFAGLEGPDSTTIDADGNLYVALCGQARFLVFNRNGFPIGQILIPGRERGEMRKSTHLAIRPGTKEAYLCAADLDANRCALFRAKVFANCYRSYQFQ